MLTFLFVAGAVLVGAQANQLFSLAIVKLVNRCREKLMRSRLREMVASGDVASPAAACPCPDCTRSRELRVN